MVLTHLPYWVTATNLQPDCPQRTARQPEETDMNGGAAAAAIAQAIKASGAIVRMEPNDFQQIVGRADEPIVVIATSKLFGKVSYKYVTSYKGLAFYTKSSSRLSFGSGAMMVSAKSIWVPQ
jgi:hypothetical protein